MILRVNQNGKFSRNRTVSETRPLGRVPVGAALVYIQASDILSFDNRKAVEYKTLILSIAVGGEHGAGNDAEGEERPNF